MDKIATKRLFLLAIFALFTFTRVFAQTITVGTIDPGPYGQGSTISVPITINDAGGCISQSNTFNLYLSDASGNFSPGTIIGSYTGFYTPFIDGIIPAGTPAGAGYKVMVKATAPAVSSSASAAFTVNSLPGVVASVTSSDILGSDVFGKCIGAPGANFLISNTSAAGTTVTASFFNEQTQTFEGQDIPIPTSGYNFIAANTTNYTIIVKSVDANGTVGTHDYQLINNLIRSNLGNTGNGFVCLVNNKGDLSFNIDVSSPNGGIQVNYPGDTYVLDWGDGSSTTYTFCELKALNGVVTHTFVLPSCGSTANGNTNSFLVQNQPKSPYCGSISAPPGVPAKVLRPAVTSFTGPLIACVGTAVSLTNTSDPGPAPNPTTSTCDNNPNALYDWTFNGVVHTGYHLGDPFIIPANTPAGTYTINLHGEVDPTAVGCPSADFSQTICLENKPQPSFTVPSPVCVSGAAVTLNNTTVANPSQCSAPQYNWTVTGPAPVTYTSGSTSSFSPQISFTSPGTYTVQLAMPTAGCGTITAPSQIIIVDGPPTATLSPDVSICGNNMTLTFDANVGITKTTFTGITQTQPTTYTWTVTSSSGGTFHFAGGTTVNSQYPKILFDSYDTYTIQVTNTNSCGTATATQKIKFVQAPIANAGVDQTVCASSPLVSLTGVITGGIATSTQWSGGNGVFSAGSSLTTTYMPTNAEVAAGQVNLTLQANTAAPCTAVTDNITINFTPTANVTSFPTAAACSGQPLGYTITADNPAATFTWTAVVTTGTPTGFTTPGSGSSINDVITNTGNTDAVVTYTIIPIIGSCPGNPFILTVTVHPLPVITAVPASSPNCNSQPAGIVLTSNVSNTSYIWTSTAAAGVSGNTNQATPIVTNSIQDILVNSGTLPANVIYTITPYNGSCPGTPVTATVVIEPSPKQSIPGPDEEVCGVNTYTLQGNDPSPGTGKWTVIQGPPGAVFDDDTNPNTLVSGLIAGNIYQFQWTISSSPACPTSSNVVNITIDKAPVGGTTSSPATVCSGDNNGQITLAGQFGTIVRWESSIDNGASWQPIVNGGGTQTYLNLTQTTQYRAVLKNGVCSEVPSTATTITVDPPPVVSVPGPNEEVCSVTTYTLKGNNPSPGTGKWTVVSGPAGAIFSDDTNPNAVVSGLLPGNVYQFRWTITGSAFCPPNSAVVNITIDKAPVGGTTSANPATVCSGDNSGQVTLSGQFGTIVRWESSIDGTTWEPITNTSTTQPFSNLTQTTQYRAILHNGSICSDVPSAPATVTVEPPPVVSVPGPNEEVCSVTTYTLKGNNPSPGTGKWTVVSGPAGAIFSDNTNPNAIVSGLLPGNVYQFRWTITGSAFCPPSSAIVNIIIDKAPVGGIASANPTTVCAGDNTGQVTLTSQFGTIVRWESSVNGTTWTSIVNTSNVQTFSNLTQTTQYRAILHNGNICSDVPSAPATVTVEPPPIASKPGPDDEVCSVTAYTLKGNSPLPGTGKWTVVSGPAGAVFSDNTNPNAVVSGLLPGNVYQFRWTITGSASCPPSSAVVSITIDKAPVGGTTSSPATVCSGDNNGQITLSGQFGTIVRWESSIDGTTWQPIANLTTTQTYSNLTQTTQYRAVLHNSNICNDVPSTPTIITVNQPAVASIPGPNEEICSITSYILQGNNPSPGTGKWTVVQGPAGATFSDDTNPNAVVSGLIPGSVYQFRWTITASAACPPSSAVVNITIDKAPIGGTTSSPATVCSGGNNGQITLTGQFGAIVRWESSTDNGISWQPISNTTTVQSYSNLTQTTQYRAIVKNTGVCPEAPSSATIITVNPVTVIADAGQGYNICNETAITLNGNDPSPFTGMWTQKSGKPVTIVDPSNHQTRVTGLSSGNIYTFTWTIKGLPPCGDTFSSITIAAYADVVPSFTQNQTHGCGPVSVTFTNTSTPAPTGTFLWNFGDGTPSVTAVDPPTHTFAPSTDGTEITYTITLTPTSNCNSQTPYIGHVKVSPLVPVAKLLPSQTSACGAFTLTAKNLSPGNNVSYDFYLKDAKGNIIQHITRTDKSDAVFQTLNATTPTFYTVYVVATDQCGNKGTSTPEIISVAPSSLISQIQIKGDVQSVCLGSPVTFQNISTGGDRFTVTIYNEDQDPILTIPAGVGDMNYTPTAAGLYYVSITAGNTGCGDAPVSALKQFMVYPDPQPGFTYTADNNYNVVFNNTTPGEGNIPASSLIYKWDFGDGSANETSYMPATHHFDFSKSPFKVTLTATTPGSNCLAVTTQIIDVKFAGNLFIPNAFVPASSNSQLNKFYAKGSGMKKWHMQIFNNFGQLVWETTKLDENGAPVEGWDGTYKGAIVEQGVYIWQISATLLNGEEWKGMSYNNSSPSRTGAIHLIR